MKVTYVDHMGDDLAVVNAARVSFGKKSSYKVVDHVKGKKVLSEGDENLIKYLGSHKHYSPFGHSFISIHVKAPIFVARQLVKHKFLRWNEISRRYVDDKPEFYQVETWRGKSEDKKQGSSGEVDISTYNLNGEHAGDWWWESLEHAVDYTERRALENYTHLIDIGVAPEQARMVLPQNTYTEWYWSGSLDAFASMCNLRCKEDTQYETRLVADMVDEIISPLFPHSWKALRDD